MNHSVYVYLRRNDFDEIINLISSVHYIIISNKGEVLKEPQFDSIENQEFNIYSRNIVQDNSIDHNQVRQTKENVYHGYVVVWVKLDNKTKSALIKAGLVTIRGEIK